VARSQRAVAPTGRSHRRCETASGAQPRDDADGPRPDPQGHRGQPGGTIPSALSTAPGSAAGQGWNCGRLPPMANIDQRAQGVARGQYGLATRRQLAEAGVGQRAIHRRTSTGIWTVHHGTVIDLGTHASSARQSLMTVMLAAGPTALVSHRCAAALHDFLDVDHPAQPEVVSSRGRHRQLAGAIIHTSSTLRPADRVWQDGFALTSVPRTLLDLAATTDERLLEIWLWDLSRRDPGVPAALAERLASATSAPGVRRLAAVLGSVRGDLDRAESPLEIHGLLALRDAGAPPPELQAVIRDPRGRFVARVDAAWPEVRVIVEFDGAAFHRGARARRADDERRARLRALGWHVIVLTADDLRRPGRLRRRVVDELRARSSMMPERPEILNG
jgi:hypothetical protein